MLCRQLAEILLQTPDLPVVLKKKQDIQIEQTQILDNHNPKYIKWSESPYENIMDWIEDQPKITVIQIS